MRTILPLFFLLFTVASSQATWADACAWPVRAGAEPVTPSHVYDGDTLRLSDGRKLRLLGINTPELGRDGAPDQPGSRQALVFARQWLAERQDFVLVYDRERRDRYGRSLGHLLDGRGDSLGRALLAEGLAWPVAVAPNLRSAACDYALAEAQRHQRRGVWSAPARPVSRLSAGDAGFMRLAGQLSRRSRARNGDWWLELEGKLAIQVRAKELGQFAPGWPESLRLGQGLELTGWVQDRSDDAGVRSRGHPAWRLQLQSPFGLWVDGHPLWLQDLSLDQ